MPRAIEKFRLTIANMVDEMIVDLDIPPTRENQRIIRDYLFALAETVREQTMNTRIRKAQQEITAIIPTVFVPPLGTAERPKETIWYVE